MRFLLTLTVGAAAAIASVAATDVIGNCDAEAHLTNFAADCLQKMLDSGGFWSGHASNQYCACSGAGDSWKGCANDLIEEISGKACKYAVGEQVNGGAHLERISSAEVWC